MTARGVRRGPKRRRGEMNAGIALGIAAAAALGFMGLLFLLCRYLMFGRAAGAGDRDAGLVADQKALPEAPCRSRVVSLTDPPGQIAMARSGPSGLSAADATHWIVVVQPAETGAA